MRCNEASSPSWTSTAPHRREGTRTAPSIVLGALLTLITIPACQDGTGIVHDIEETVVPRALTLTPSTFKVSEGDSLLFGATLGGAPVAAASGVWRIEPATAGTIHSGSLVATRQGDVTVTLELSGRKAEAAGQVVAIPSSVNLNGPPPLAGTVGHELPDSVSVLVVTADGRPAQGATVYFDAAQGHGFASPSSAETGPDGVARAAWTLGTRVGRHSLRVQAPGTGELSLEVEALADFASATVTPLGSDELEGEVGDVLGTPLTATVADTFGNVLPHHSVRWTFTDGTGGEVADAGLGWSPVFEAITDESGRTTVGWRLGTKACTQEAIASVASSLAATAGKAPKPNGGNGRWKAKAKAGEPVAVAVDPGALSLAMGGQDSLGVRVEDRFGNPVPDAEVAWSSSKSTVVGVDAHGRVSAESLGTATVAAAHGQLVGAAQVDVVVSAPAHVLSVSGANQVGAVGEALDLPLRAQVVDPSGRGVSGQSVTWSLIEGSGSLAATATTTDAGGYAEVVFTLGTQAGDYGVRAAVAGVGSVDFMAEAQPGPVAVIDVTPPSATAEVGGTSLYAAVAADAFGNPVSPATWVWSSSAPGVATVNGSGLATAMATGTAKIRATVGAVSGSADFVVSESVGVGAIVASVAGDGQSAPVGQRLAAPIRVRVIDGKGAPVADESVSWSVVSGGGTLGHATTTTNYNGYSETVWTMGPNVGPAQARATVGGGSAVSFTATVVASAVASIQVMPGIATAEAGGTRQYSASAVDAFGNPVAGVTMVWSSSTPGVATVNGSGLATAIAEGTTEIRASAGAVSGLASLIVAASHGSSELACVAGDGQSAPVGERLPAPIRVRVTDASGAPVAGQTVAWSVASGGGTLLRATTTTNSNGYSETVWTMGPQAGPAVAQASVSGESAVAFSATATAEATGGTASLEVTPGTVSLASIGATFQLSATATDATGGTVSNPGFVWHSLDTGIATVNSSGLVTAMGVGTALIVVSAACCGSDTAIASVAQLPAEVAVSPTAIMGMSVGASRQFNATVKDASGATIHGASVTWSSANPSVATVSGTGRATAVGAGTTQIRATSGGQSGVAVFGVAAPPPPPTGGGVVFADDFEFGDLSKTMNGSKWGHSVRTSVSDAIAHTGRYSLRFSYEAVESGKDSFTEQRYLLGRTTTEFWVRFWIYYPDGTEGVGPRYVHRDEGATPDNNKFFKIWGGDSYFLPNQLGTSTRKRWQHPGDARIHLEYGKDEGPIGEWGAGGYQDFITNSERGRWVEYKMYGKFATGPDANNGKATIWWDGQVIAQWTDLDLWSSQANFWDRGYLLGWSASGFDQQTYVYIDDIAWYDTDPGW